MTDKRGATILDTPKQIELFHLMQMKYALKIEINTGMRHSRGSIMNLVNKTLGTSYQTKQTAYDAIDAYIGEKTKHLREDPA